MNKTRFLRILAALFFVVAGAAHFFNPSFYLTIMPPALPQPLALVYLSGLFEILGGLGLLFPRTRRFAGHGLILLLIAVFPANIYMFTQSVKNSGLSVESVFLALRLPVQVFFIYAVNRLAKSK